MEPLTAASVAAHDGVAGRALWAVIDGHVLDVSQFAAVHPGGAGKIQEQPNRDCSAQFRVHFGATVAELRAAFARGRPSRRTRPGGGRRCGTSSAARARTAASTATARPSAPRHPRARRSAR